MVHDKRPLPLRTLHRSNDEWADFVEWWVRDEHGNDWDYAGSHWYDYLAWAVQLKRHRTHNGHALIRAAEHYSQNFIRLTYAGGERCVFCIIDSRKGAKP
ncbi:DUF6313 family protein [Mycetocola tolaasinivorans]|uniref:DUF6313 family protein n=1 Tax=Mycetocola tolaasinivorans TaxID=76635 RepID=UPI001C7CC51C